MRITRVCFVFDYYESIEVGMGVPLHHYTGDDLQSSIDYLAEIKC